MRQSKRAKPEMVRLAYSIDEVAGFLGLGRTKIYLCIRDGSLRAKKVGEKTIILHDDLMAFVTGLPDYASRRHKLYAKDCP